VKIRTRAFAVLWLIAVLVAGTIGFILYALNVAAPQMDAERQRISEVLQVHGSLWRALVDLKHDQHDLAATDLPSLRERVRNERAAVDDYLARQATLVVFPDQQERLEQIRKAVETWTANWDSTPSQSGSPEVLLTLSNNDFAPIERLLIEFDERARRQWDEAIQIMTRRRGVFFWSLSILAALGMMTLAALILSTKKVILDPLTELTASAQRIETGDFGAAHQTLRADEIGVLFNSFARMVQGVQTRERELAHALNESRELATVTAEARRRVEVAHADLLATLETVPAALLIFNVDGSVRLRNRAATEVLGIEPQNPELRKNYWSRFKRVATDGTPIPTD
jgi:nitrate/nitrite-specific signal transduction histidine kinase